MIAIKSVDKQTAAERCASLSLPLCNVYEMTDRGQVLATACVTSGGKEAQVLYLNAPDMPLTDALLRAVLNAVLAQGAVTAQIMDDRLQNYMITKGYLVDGMQRSLKIAEFFSKSCCNAEKVLDKT